MSTAIRCTKKAEGIPALDIIRIMSALSILLYHYTTRYDEVIGHTSDWRFLWPWGAEAVNVFFFLSGFLAIIHFRNQKFIVSLKKKAVRLYPTYWICLIISAAVTFAFLKEERWVGIRAFLINFTMLQSALGVRSVDGAYWTLWYDIVFYIVVACFQASRINKSRINRFMLLWLSLAFLCLALSGNSAYPIVLMRKALNRFLILDRIWAFVSGTMIAHLIEYKSRLSCVVLVLSIIYPLICGNTISAILLASVSLMVFLICNCQTGSEVKQTSSLVVRRGLSYMASLTYPIYLLHQNIGFAIIKLLQSRGMKGEICMLLPFLIVLLLAAGIQEQIIKRLSLAL